MSDRYWTPEHARGTGGIAGLLCNSVNKRIEEPTSEVFEQARSWIAVCNLLDEVCPNWNDVTSEMSGVDSVLYTIRDLAFHARIVLDAKEAPSGWKLVPLEPTYLMTFRGQAQRFTEKYSMGSIYRAMIAAAPPFKPNEQQK